MAKTPTERRRRPAAATGSNIGGRREGGAVARFTEQLVALVLPDRRTRVMSIVEAHQVSQAAVMRAIIDFGLPEVEQRIAEGRLDPAMLP